MFSHSFATALVACVSLAFGAMAAPAADLKSMLEAPVERNLYPDPIEKALARVREPADQVLCAYRAAAVERLKNARKDGVAYFLAPALAQHHMAVAWSFTRAIERAQLSGDDAPAGALAGALESVPLPADRAAFAPVLDRLPAALAPRFAAAREQAAAAARALESEDALAAYVAGCAATADFYAKARLWTRAARAMHHGIEGLVDRVEGKVSLENLMRFFRRVAAGPLPRTAAHAADALVALRARLLEAARVDLADRLAGGLGEKTQFVDLLVGGGLRTRTSVLLGRVRQLSQAVQAMPDAADRALFIPVFSDLDRWVAGQLSGAAAGAARDYLTRVHSALSNTAAFLKRGVPFPDAHEDEPADFDAIRGAVKADDAEGLFTEL